MVNKPVLKIVGLPDGPYFGPSIKKVGWDYAPNTRELMVSETKDGPWESLFRHPIWANTVPDKLFVVPSLRLVVTGTENWEEDKPWVWSVYNADYPDEKSRISPLEASQLKEISNLETAAMERAATAHNLQQAAAQNQAAQFSAKNLLKNPLVWAAGGLGLYLLTK
jgi:hypothetical protein